MHEHLKLTHGTGPAARELGLDGTMVLIKVSMVLIKVSSSAGTPSILISAAGLSRHLQDGANADSSPIASSRLDGIKFARLKLPSRPASSSALLVALLAVGATDMC